MHLEQIKTKSHDSFLNYIENFTDMVKELSSKYTISSIGIGAPNFDSGSNTFCPVNFNWTDVSPFNLEKHLEHEVNIPTSVVNDANAVALAENRYGIGRSVNSFVIITIGTGLGAGIVINNHLLMDLMVMQASLGIRRWRILTGNVIVEGLVVLKQLFRLTELNVLTQGN